MRKISIFAISLLLLMTSVGHASTPGKVDNFEGGGTQSWREGSGSSNPPTNIGSGGPEGVDDNYLRNSSDGGNFRFSAISASIVSCWSPSFEVAVSSLMAWIVDQPPV